MLVKRGINTTREEKHVIGVRKEAETKKAAASVRSDKKIVRCSNCGAKFEKACPRGYLCDVVNNTCPKCQSGTLE